MVYFVTLVTSVIFSRVLFNFVTFAMEFTRFADSIITISFTLAVTHSMCVLLCYCFILVKGIPGELSKSQSLPASSRLASMLSAPFIF